MKFKRTLEKKEKTKAFGGKTREKTPRDENGLSAMDIAHITSYIDSGLSISKSAEKRGIKSTSFQTWKNKPHIKAGIQRMIYETVDMSKMKYQVFTDRLISLGLKELEALEKYTENKNKYDTYFQVNKTIHEDVVACMRRRKGDIPEIYTPNYNKTIDLMSKVYGKGTSLNINIDNKNNSKSPVVILPAKTEISDVDHLLTEHKNDLQKEFEKDAHGVEIKDAIDVSPTNTD